MEKLDRLKRIIRGLGSAVTAFSGGVDSSFLLKVASDVLPDEKLLAVTARSETYTEIEYREAKRFARCLGVRHKMIWTDELSLSNFKDNPSDRCYYCKKELFGKLRKIADEEGLAYILDGTNLDDLEDHRPGRKAAKELGVISPLIDAGLTKEDIRQLSKKFNLYTWDKPALACLASRFPYGERLSRKRLKIVEEAESYLRKLGFKNVRVRYHKTIARIEIGNNEIDSFLKDGMRQKVIKRLKKIGFIYVTLDLEGYRSGSMNEALSL